MSSPAAPEAAPQPQATPRRFYVPQLDGLRFLAFLLVFVHHGPRFGGLFPSGSLGRAGFDFLKNWGWFGVDLFLVLSAFLITSLLLIEHERHRSISLRGFYMRRILRIWPLYYLMIGIGFFLLPWLSLFAFPLHSPQHAQLMKDHFLPFCTLFGNYSSGAHGYPAVATLGHMWTVTLEEQFYVAWPLTLTLMLRVRRGFLWLLLAILLAATIALRLHLVGGLPHPYIWTNTLARLDPLVIGIAIAVWRHSHAPRPGWIAPIVKLAAGLLLVTSIAFAPPIETQSKNVAWQFLATAAGFGLILDATLARGKNPLSWLLSARPLVWLGKLTYGLYVYHVLGLQIGQELVDFLQSRHIVTSVAGAFLSHSLISLLVTVGIAAESYRLFESFFLRLKDRWSRIKSRPVDPRPA
ncbi:MAG: acyltransferase [Deltaproteobacteria bacterium]|nr:acyltransferase [Deltaproteobacteria bacterium]